MDDLDSSNSGFADVKTVNSLQLQLKQVSLVTSLGGKITGSPILTDISFEVLGGDRICLIGPSGAGKTSLLRLLNRLSEPTSGAIYLENQDIKKIPVIQLRRQVMLVPQEPKLLGMTVKEALAYPLVLQQLPKQEISLRLEACREQAHIPADWLERTELQLSVGQRQLVAIARALITQPKILLLDEPTSALDAGIASHVLAVLTDLTLQGKMTILMINHQLDMAQLFCTRVLYLQEGQLLQDAPVTQIDWKQLRETLVQAEARASQEWI
ncbi:MAG: ATP-binding cassette domain-containing protein [Symplocastrum torsivum CPER-KK1]|jgi:D-methionine transport system ATP-binding protein|uniref:ATP-binding cassette domain-containing protein n=1 Tax=Symplocastrum torsivum CPER-KK1 TaxID=450513 RepID=A0A951U830_9CYAN|nr:ATP-binding cassette domain-containing protein [Symplocastrum torsivum CPER-KK1]